VQGREYPSRPILGAAVLVRRGDAFLFLRRALPPNEGRWTIPGGVVEVGERVEDAAVREALEETGLEVKIDGLLGVADDLHYDGAGKVRYHFVVVDFVGTSESGDVRLNRESSGSRWVGLDGLDGLEMPDNVRELLASNRQRLDEAVLNHR
jgi:8-oxo-dGTP diphosphatase